MLAYLFLCNMGLQCGTGATLAIWGVRLRITVALLCRALKACRSRGRAVDASCTNAPAEFRV